jgi:hypothetical protein
VPARAHLGSRKGFIDFVDGDKQNPHANNLTINDEETPTSVPLMMPDPMPKSRVTVFR